MKHIKSTLNLRTPRPQNGIKSLSIFPNEIHERKHYYSPHSHTQLLSIPSNENIQKNPSFPVRPEGISDKNEGRKDKKEINIRLNIQSEIIHNNYLQQQFQNKKYSTSSLMSNEEVLQYKEKQIVKLKKDLAKTKSQISILLNDKNLKQTIDKIDHSESNLSDRMIKMSIFNKKKAKENSPSKSTTLITNNVRQFFRNNLKNNKTQSTKQITHLNHIISPKHFYSSDIAAEKDKNEDTNTNISNNIYNRRNLKKSLKSLQIRASNIFNMYINMCNNSSG